MALDPQSRADARSRSVVAQKKVKCSRVMCEYDSNEAVPQTIRATARKRSVVALKT